MVETAVEAKTVALVLVDKVRFGYGRQPVLYDVSLRIDAGEMVGLLGPNGSGKTTLLRLLSGLLQPQQGRILLEGRSLQTWGRRAVAQRIAVVPQELHLPFAFSVEHMVGLGRTPFVSPFWGTYTRQDQAIVQQAMNAAGVAPLAQRIFNDLSGGERQRVLIAMALAQQPVVLLLDEPTAHLDIKYQVETLELVQQLNRDRHMTVVAAMHDLNLAARYFPRLLLFQRGVVADGGPAEVLEADLLSRVYDVDVQVGILRGAQHLSVLLPSEHAGEDFDGEPGQPYVHVMAGGGSGELVMRALADTHIPFVAGALHIGDSDYTLALRLAQHVITEQPYAPISPATLEKVRMSLARVSLLILCPAPLGPGNLALLQEAVYAAQHGLCVVLLAPEIGTSEMDDWLQRTGIATRDYTGGDATRLVEALSHFDTRIVGSVGAVVDVVRRYAQGESPV